MQPAIMGIFIGVITAISLKNQKKITPPVIRTSLTTELMVIVILALIEIV